MELTVSYNVGMKDDHSITKANFAREIGVSKARVSQLLKLGLPVQSDGRLDREQALDWYRANITPPMIKLGRQNPTLAQMEAADPAPPEEEARLITKAQFRECWGKAALEGAAWIANELRHPERVQVIAEMAARLGCSAAQAYGIADVYERLVTGWVFPLASEDEDEIVLYDREPDWAKVAELAGEPVDLQAWVRHTDETLGSPEPCASS